MKRGERREEREKKEERREKREEKGPRDHGKPKPGSAMLGAPKLCLLRTDLQVVLVSHGALRRILALGSLCAVDLIGWNKLRAGRAA